MNADGKWGNGVWRKVISTIIIIYFRIKAYIHIISKYLWIWSYEVIFTPPQAFLVEAGGWGLLNSLPLHCLSPLRPVPVHVHRPIRGQILFHCPITNHVYVHSPIRGQCCNNCPIGEACFWVVGEASTQIAIMLLHRLPYLKFHVVPLQKLIQHLWPLI